MRSIRSEIRLMYQKDLIALSQQVQQLRANMMRLLWNWELQYSPKMSEEDGEEHEEMHSWGNAAYIHSEEFEADLKQIAKIIDPKKPSNL